MDPELNEQTEQQNHEDFMAGFNAVRNSDDAQPSPEPKVVEPEPVASQTESTEQPKTEPEAEGEQQPAAEEQKYFGFSESEIKSLLERSAKVDSIEDQLRKAHGKIGELNSHFQELAKQKPTPAAPVSAEAEVPSGVAKDFPELAAFIDARARQIASELAQGQSAQASVTEPEAVERPLPTKEDLVREANIEVMDATYEGWREKVVSQDFTIWLATQPEDVQQAFNTTVSAKVLGGVISSFDAWKAKTQDRGNKSQKRLEQALVPTGTAAKTVSAPSAHDEFLAGFNAVRSRY